MDLDGVTCIMGPFGRRLRSPPQGTQPQSVLRHETMKTYLVGGAVRDQLLQLPVQDRDWVVVGATPAQMLQAGFKQVGKDFPVFLHPETNEEYALARTERKTGPGYKGFEVHADAGVTLEEDLRRRDLTINAMALDEDGALVDPFNGRADLDQGLLRHVSPAFAEDPVRILRVARLAARYARWGFRVAHATQALMRSMVQAGEVDALVPERVWAETDKALAEPNPERFFQVLRSCGALAKVFPELAAACGPAATAHQAGKDDTTPALRALQTAVRLSAARPVRFAALVYGLGTPALEALCQRLRLPVEFSGLALTAARFCPACGALPPARHTAELAAALLDMLQGADAFRRPERFAQFLLVCEAGARAPTDTGPYRPAELLQRALRACRGIDNAAIAAGGVRGADFAAALRQQRLQAIGAALATTD